jgi:hypothetical protein
VAGKLRSKEQEKLREWFIWAEVSAENSDKEMWDVRFSQQ